MKIKYIIIFVALFSIGFYFYKNANKDTNRWYSNEEVIFGKQVFLNNCARCHGEKAEKTIDWKRTLADGSYPSTIK